MKFFIVTFFLLASFNLFAVADVEVISPVIKLNPPGMQVTAIFMNVTNHSDKDLKITKVSGDFAETFELHTMEMVYGKMSMRSVDSILLKKKSTAELKSGGLHIMVFDLKKPLKEGDLHKLKLTLDNKSEIEISAKVLKMN